MYTMLNMFNMLTMLVKPLHYFTGNVLAIFIKKTFDNKHDENKITTVNWTKLVGFTGKYKIQKYNIIIDTFSDKQQIEEQISTTLTSFKEQTYYLIDVSKR